LWSTHITFMGDLPVFSNAKALLTLVYTFICL
jgi:hypothetical protein